MDTADAGVSWEKNSNGHSSKAEASFRDGQHLPDIFLSTREIKY